MAEIILDNLTKVYPDGSVAVEDLSLRVAEGEFLVLVGPSGCGKSTVLRCVAGLERPTSGTIILNGRVINDLPPQKRNLAMVFQTYALYPHMSIYENLAFGLKMQGMSPEEMRPRVQAVAEKLGISQHLPRKPRELSGGERQRVALGRAMVRQPQAFLMDEPLSNLDAALRVKMRTELLKLQRDLGATVLYVTHDQTEAMTMGDRVAVLHQGHLQQVAPPQELYDRPANQFVAGFIGSPAMNFITARLTREARGLCLELGGQKLPLPPDYLEKCPGLTSYWDQQVLVGVRPEHLVAAGRRPETMGPLQVKVEVVETLGAVNYVYFTLPNPLDPKCQEATFTGALEPDVPAKPGTDLELAIDPYRLHFFDPETKKSLSASFDILPGKLFMVSDVPGAPE